MRLINIVDDFGLRDISEEEDVLTIIDKIIVKSDKEVTLDISGCLIDYPATSMIIDAVLKQMMILDGDKVLYIITDFVLPTTTIANWILLGSKIFNLIDDKGLTLEQLHKAVFIPLSDSHTMINIAVNDTEGKLIDEIKLPA